MHIPKEITTKHRVWIAFLTRLGCNYDTAEDLVQEMYIKLAKFLETNELDDKYYFFIYVTLRNLFIDLKRQEKRSPIVVNSDMIHKGTKEYNNYNFEKDEKVEEQLKAIHKWLNDSNVLEEDFSQVWTNKEKSELYYLRKIFQEIFQKGISIREFSKQTNIKYYSLYNTIKIIKKQIRKKYYEN